MISVWRATILAFCILLFPYTLLADEERRYIDESKIPTEGLTPTDFIPPGWMIEDAVSNDLNGDHKRDLVLELIELPSLKTDEEPAPVRSRALVILLRTKSGGFHRVALAKRLLRCPTCFGAMAGEEGSGADIRIVKGVITVEEIWGARETVKTELRFRFNPRSKHVELIGEDIEHFDRGTGSKLNISSNYLTGVKLIEQQEYDRQSERFIKISTKSQRIPKIKRFIDDMDYQEYEK